MWVASANGQQYCLLQVEVTRLDVVYSASPRAVESPLSRISVRWVKDHTASYYVYLASSPQAMSLHVGCQIVVYKMDTSMSIGTRRG